MSYSSTLAACWDFTTPSVLIVGEPPTIAGLLEPAQAHEDVALADLGGGLRQSGCPGPQPIGLDPARLGRFVAGYAGVRPLPAAARSLALYPRARGLPLIVKWVTQGAASCAITRERVAWLTAHGGQVTDAIAAALRP